MKYKDYRQKKQNFNSGFTLVEIILSSSISIIIILVGYYLSNIVSQANKNDKSQIQLFSKIDSATDFIVDEINSGKRIFIDKNNITSNCNVPKGEFLLGISLPAQATESDSYSSKVGTADSWNIMECPVIYYLNKGKTNIAENEDYELWRYGPPINKKGFYSSEAYINSIITDKISTEPLEEIKCSNSWTKINQKGISLCVDNFRRSAEINITANLKKSGGKDLYISKTSGALNRIQDDSLLGINNNLKDNESDSVCNNQNSCHVFGTKIVGNVTFLIDISNSMASRDRRNRIQGRIPIEAVKYQLIKAINNLRNSKFQVIAFGTWDIKMWDSPRLATPSNRALATNWVKDLSAYHWYTKPSSSIKTAIDDMVTDQIILLSDGIPSSPSPYCDSRGKYYGISDCLTEYNLDKRKNTSSGKVRIDTIAVSVYGDNNDANCNFQLSYRNWFGKIASANGGKCSVIK